MISLYGIDLVDMNTNMVHYTDVNMVTSSQINTSIGEKRIYADLDADYWWDNSDSSNDYHAVIRLYSLVPVNCEQLAYKWENLQEERTIEEWIEHWNSEDKEETIVKQLSEVMAEDPKLKHLFFQ